MNNAYGTLSRAASKPSRGPMWATAYEMYELVPDIKYVIKGHHTASNFLSHSFRMERVTRRDRNPNKEHTGKGRTPQFEYNTASVKRLVKELMGR